MPKDKNVENLSRKEALDWCNQHPETHAWLTPLAPTTAILYAKSMYRYHQFTSELPTQLLELAKEGKRRGEPLAERHLEEAIRAIPGSPSMKKDIADALRSFYGHHLYDLARKALQLDVARKKPIRCPTQEELRQFKVGMNIRDIALVDFLASVPVREATLCTLKWSHVWPELIQKPTTPTHVQIMGHELKGGGIRQYKDLEMHAFLHDDAAKSLLRYKHWREARGEAITPDSQLFADVRRNAGQKASMTTSAVRGAFQRASHRTNIQVSPHDLRRFVQTQLEEARLQPNWIRKLMGKTVKGEEAPYSRPKIEKLRGEFTKATPFLTLEPHQPNEAEQRKRSILDSARLLLPPDKLAALENVLAQAKTMKEVDEGIHNITATTHTPPSSHQKRKKQTDTDPTAEAAGRSGTPRQAIVEETDLPNHLSHGWRVAATLPSGKIVIEKTELENEE